MMNHPAAYKAPGHGFIVFRKVPRGFEWWHLARQQWCAAPTKPSKLWKDTTISYDDTWCEPHEDFTA